MDMEKKTGNDTPAGELEALRKRVAELETVGQQFKATLYGIGDGMIATDAQGRVQQMNPVAEELTGWIEAEARGRFIDEVFCIFNEQTRAPVESPVVRVLREGTVVGLANHTLLVARDGTKRPVADSGAPIRDRHGAVTGVVLVFRDQTKERLARDREAHLKKVLLAVRRVNQLIVSETDPQQLIERACANLTRTLGYHNVWIALTDERGEIVTSTAVSGFDSGFGVMRGRLEHCEFSACMKRTLERDELVVVRDPSVECPDCPLSGQYAGRAGLTRHMSHKGRLYGILSASVPAAHVHDAEEQHLFNEVANDLAFALSRIEDAQALRFATHIVDSSPAVAFVWGNNGWGVWYASENVERLFGYTASEFVSGSVSYADVVHPEDLERVSMEADAAGADITAERVEHAPYRIVTRNGDIKWVEDMTTIQRAQDGGVKAYRGILLDITGRKQAEEALRKSELRYRNIFEGSRDGFVMVDPEGRFIDANQAYCAMLDYSLDELFEIGDFYKITPERWHDWESGEIWDNRLLVQGYTGIYEKEYIRRDGSIFPVELQAYAVSGEDGAPEYFWAVVRDITKRKRAEEMLRNSEERFRELADMLPEVVFETDLNLKPIYANQHAFELFGYSREDMARGLSGLDMLVPEDRDRVIANFSMRLKGENTGAVECRALKKDGSVFPVLFHADLIVKKGKISGLRGILVDITDSKRAEKERERLMYAIEQAGEAIVITDAEGTIQYINPAFEHITGYTRAEAVGRNPRILKSGEQDDKFYNEMWGILTSGKVWSGRFINRRKDGSFYTEEATISPVMDSSGVITNYVAVKRDVTEYLRLRAEKAKIEEQFRRSQKLESIGRLAGGVAHDLNNLLTPILGYGEILLEDARGENAVWDDARKGHVKTIVQAGMRARDLVRQLLAFSRMQSLELKPLDLNVLLENFGKLLRRTIREDINIRLFPAESLPLILADAGQLEQIIMNLAVNAQDAMPDGGELTIETARVELDKSYAERHDGVKPGLYVMLVVSDTGCGMDTETREHIFEPFFTTKGKDRGTGLGLATVYGIVKQHGGNIWIYSEPGLGATFKVYLPVSGETRAEKETGEKRSADLSGFETVLLVEDNEQVRDLSLAILKQKGYTVLVADSGKKALALLDRHDGPVHLLLTDVVMPGMNGKQLFEQVSERYPDVRVLYMSGYTENIIAHHGVMGDGVQFIQKPFSVKSLAAKVREALGN